MIYRSIVFYCFLLASSDAFRVSNYFRDMQTTSDPDTYLTPPQIIRKNGYPAESHTILSADGYLIEVHRIPYGKSGKGEHSRYPILLHHGLLCSTIDWVINGPQKSLAYRLADEGYDVWMPNARGNTFSRGHIKYSPQQREFWNYSFHEMGIYDITAVIDHILDTTDNSQLIYVGHSLGTTLFYVMASSRPEYNQKIKAQISLAPVAGLSHTTSMFRFLVPYAKTIHEMSDWYSKGAFLEHDLMTKIFCKIFCGKNYFNHNLCEQIIIFGLFGKDPQQFNTSLIPVISSNIPAGTSGKNMIHCSQLISSGKFQQYDYGLSGNVKKYHSSTPPLYDLSLITTPIRVYYGQNDILADPLDARLFYQKLPKPMGLIKIDYDKFNHVDFIWAIDVNRLLNNDLIRFIKNMTDFDTGSQFIEDNVEIAKDIRSKTPPPVDVPFNVSKFMDKFDSFSGSIPAMPGLPDMYGVQQSISETVSKVKNEIGSAVQKTEAAIDGVVIKGIQEGGTKAKQSVDAVGDQITKQVITVKVTVDKATSDVENQIKLALEKLHRIFA